MKSKQKSAWWQIPASILFTSAILYFLFQMIDWNSFLSALRALRIQTLVIVFIVFFASLVIQGIKYWFFVRPKASLRASICAYGPGNFLTNMPAGIVAGPTVHVMLLRPWINPVVSVSTLFLDMFTKVITLFLFMVIGVFSSTVALPMWMYIGVISVSIALIALLFLLIYPKSSNWLLRTTQKLNHTKIGKYTITKKFVEAIEQLCESSRLFQSNHNLVWVHLFLGLLIEFMLALPYMILAREVGIALPLQNWIWIHCAVRIFCMLPLTVGGLGAREAALLLINRWLGIPSGQVMTLSLLYSVMFILSLALGSAILFLMRPRKAKLKLKEGSYHATNSSNSDLFK